MMKSFNYSLFAILALLLTTYFGIFPAHADGYKLSFIKRFYSIGTASINGTYYPVGNAIARTLSQHFKDRIFIAEPTAGSVANIDYLKNGRIDFALVQSDVAWQAARGKGLFENNRFPELRVMASLYSEVIQIVVKKDRGIKTIRDLKGCKISAGSKDSGSAVNVVQVLGAAGLKENDYELVYERFTKATESLRDGYVDAVYYTGGIPADGIARLAAKTDIVLLEVPEDVKSALIKDYPFFSAEIIPGNSYAGQTEKVSTIGLRALLVTTDMQSDDLVNKMLETVYGRSGSSGRRIYSEMINFNRQDSLKGFDVEMLHPGAKRFFGLARQ
ncbi:MAG: TAXI family TRAP transporter solute-binding subunit [Candidatus Rifleibacteriota bacterium]